MQGVDLENPSPLLQELRSPQTSIIIETGIERILQLSVRTADELNQRVAIMNNAPLIPFSNEQKQLWKIVFPEIFDRLALAKKRGLLFAADVANVPLLSNKNRAKPKPASSTLSYDYETVTNLFYRKSFRNVPLELVGEQTTLLLYLFPRLSAHYDHITRRYNYRHTSVTLEVVPFTQDGRPIVKFFIDAQYTPERIFAHFYPGEVSVSAFTDRADHNEPIEFSEFNLVQKAPEKLLPYIYEISISQPHLSKLTQIPIPTDDKTRLALYEISTLFKDDHLPPLSAE